jgi:hypothetical protein
MTYYDALLRAIDGWNENPITDEWLFAQFREEFVSTMSTLEAFESIGETVDLLLRQTDESTATEILQTIIALARQSDTTEIPPKLLAQKAALMDQFVNFGDYAKNKLQELFKYYRLD